MPRRRASRRGREDKWEDMPPDEVCPPFPFLRLQPEMRREVLKFVVSVSPNHGARFFERQARENHPRDQTETFPLEDMDHARAGSATCTHWSTAACLSTVIHHTRTTRTVCSAIRGDIEALERPRSPLATPRVWLAHLYELPPAIVREMSGQQVFRELLSRAAVGRRANLVAEMQCRYGKAFATCGWDRRREDEDRPRNSFELVADCPLTWSDKRTEAARNLTSGVKRATTDYDAKSWAVSRVRTNEERFAVAPIDAPLLRSLAASAFDSLRDSLLRQTWTAHARVVSLEYDHEGVKPTPDTLDELGRRIDAFFGAATMAQHPWIIKWTNKLTPSGAPFSWDSYKELCEDNKGDSVWALNIEDYHDSERPPLTRWQDVFTMLHANEVAQNKSRTELHLTNDLYDLGSVAKIFATFDETMHQWEDSDENNIKAWRHFAMSSAWCPGTPPRSDPNTRCGLFLDTCQKDGSYLNRGELYVRWEDIPGFHLQAYVAIPSLS